VRTTHYLQAVGTCPVDESVLDVYEVEVVVEDSVLPVERVIEAVRVATAEPIFQEDLTERLAAALDASVRTTGYHSGVRTVCEA
jgi:GTP cyclohydrolase I